MWKALNRCHWLGGAGGWISGGHARCHQSSVDNRDQAPTKGESSQAGSPLQFHRSQLPLSRRSSGWVLTCSFCSPGSPLLTSISQRNAPRSLPCRALIGSRWDFFQNHSDHISSSSQALRILILLSFSVCGWCVVRHPEVCHQVNLPHLRVHHRRARVQGDHPGGRPEIDCFC